MKKIILSLLVSFNLFASDFDLSKVIGEAELAKDANQIILNLGLNCGQIQNIPSFISEVKSLLAGMNNVATEMSLQLGLKKDFPTMCHVFTQNQINSYREGTKTDHEYPCIASYFGKCIKRKHVKKERPQPSYWWPKYFIEVTEKGNDPHEAFGNNNPLYQLNRKLANSLSILVDENGAVKLTSYVLGGSTLLSAIGVKTGTVDAGQLAKASVLTPLEKLRFRGSKSKSQTTYDVNLWPVANSKVIAKNLSVCGPELARSGQHPGGYSWSMEGISMTCPISMSSDAFAYWDTAMLDYIDPEIVSGMVIGSNPLSCGIAYAAKIFSEMNSDKGNAIGDQGPIQQKLSSVSGSNGESLKNCSWPILGTAEAIASKSLTLTNLKKWTEIKCSLWGSIAPRISSLTYSNDYSYANTALKFKLLSHEMFGVPRGEQERWSLAYPWEGKGSSSSSLSSSFSGITQKLNSGTGELLKKNKINVTGDYGGSSRSESLFVVGSPSLVNASTSSKYIQDRIKNHAKELGYAASMINLGAVPFLGAEVARMKNSQSGGNSLIPGDRRIYTIWEKISCTSQSQKITEEIPLMPTISFYDSCQSTFKFEVYKYVQLKLLRRICDSLGEVEGLPWN